MGLTYLHYVYPIILLIGYLRLGSKMSYVNFQDSEKGEIFPIIDAKHGSLISVESRVCPDCGTSVIKGEKFCFKCGKHIE